LDLNFYELCYNIYLYLLHLYGTKTKFYISLFNIGKYPIIHPQIMLVFQRLFYLILNYYFLHRLISQILGFRIWEKIVQLRKWGNLHKLKIFQQLYAMCMFKNCVFPPWICSYPLTIHCHIMSDICHMVNWQTMNFKVKKDLVEIVWKL